MNDFARIMAAGAIALLSVTASSRDREVASPEAMAGEMLSVLGGREAWAGVTNTVNESMQYRLGNPTVVTAVITMDFTRPRFRIETTAPGLHLIRTVDGEKGWRLTREGVVEDLPTDLLDADLAWYAGHVYRTLHRVAARDPALRLIAAGPRRLEIYEGAARVAWFALDAHGEPYAFGAHDDDVGSITGPWDYVRDGIHHPSWVTRPDGQWRARVVALAVNVELDDAVFARPDPAN